MLVFQPAPIQGVLYPTSFSGIYSEDDYVNDMASRAAHDYALAHARVQAIQRQRNHYNRPHHYQHHPGDIYGGRLVPASLDNFSYSFGPASSARPSFFSPNHRRSATSFEELAYSVLQEEERQRALNRQLEVITRQRELAREREAQRRRALTVAAAREQQARAAHAARVKARQARDEELLLSLLGQLGLGVAPARSAPVTPQVNRQQVCNYLRQTSGLCRLTRVLHQPPLMFIQPVTYAAPAPASVPLPADRKGKAKAVDAPVKIRAAIPRHAPVPANAPTLKEELRTRMRTETDPEVRETLFSLYSDLFDAPKPAQPVAGPSGRKHVSFEVPISGPSSSFSPASAPMLIKTEEKIEATSPPPSAPAVKTESTSTARKSDGAHLHRTPALPPAVAAKLLKFYRARRARKLSLGQIKDVEDALRNLEGAFEFPAQLDFVSDRSPSPSPSPSPDHSEPENSDGESASLAYTANNKPVRAYEHALTELLARLDAVESNGDLEVRGRRKEVVKEVERALETMERRIEESRERSRERATRRRGSVSSQVSDASVTVTPYNVHSSDNVNELEVVVAAEETPVEVRNEVVEVPTEVEEPETAPDVEDAEPIAEDTDTALQVEADGSAPVATQDVLEPNVDIVQPEFPQLAVEIPDNSANTNAPSPLEQLTHTGPSLPINEVNPPLSSSSLPSDTSIPHLVSSGVASEPAEASQGTSEGSTLPASVRVVASETISPDESASTDAATLAVAEPNSDCVPLPADPEAATVFTAGPNNIASPTSSSEPIEVRTPPFNLESAPYPGKETALGFMASSSARDDEVEMISEDEVELVRDGPGSDWSDVGSESCL